MQKSKKEEVIARVSEQLNRAKGIYFVEFHGITAEEDVRLRSGFRKNGRIEYQVVKNTLIKKAIERVGTCVESVHDLRNTTGVVFGYEDAIEPGKILKKVIDDNKNLKFKSALVEGVYFGTGKLDAVASMATKEENLAKVGGLIKQIVGGIPTVIHAVMMDLAYVIQEGAKKKNA